MTWKQNLRQWIADLLWDAIKTVSIRLHNYIFDPLRAAQRRNVEYERWVRYKMKAEQTQDPLDDRRAKTIGVLFGFDGL